MDYILPRTHRRMPSVAKLLIALILLLALSSGVATSVDVAFADQVPAQPGFVPAPALAQEAPPPESLITFPPPDVPANHVPGLPEGSGSGRRVVYSNSRQRVWLVEGDGRIAGSWLVSGRQGVPRPGTYRVFSKSRYSSARGGRVRMEFMTRFARGRSLAIGFHSIPVDRAGRPIQSESELGRYRSAGCVRQKWADALALWNWAPVGTVVVVTP